MGASLCGLTACWVSRACWVCRGGWTGAGSKLATPRLVRSSVTAPSSGPHLCTVTTEVSNRFLKSCQRPLSTSFYRYEHPNDVVCQISKSKTTPLPFLFYFSSSKNINETNSAVHRVTTSPPCPPLSWPTSLGCAGSSWTTTSWKARSWRRLFYTTRPICTISLPITITWAQYLVRYQLDSSSWDLLTTASAASVQELSRTWRT